MVPIVYGILGLILTAFAWKVFGWIFVLAMWAVGGLWASALLLWMRPK